MSSCPAPLFRKRQFDATVIVTCVRWYLRFALSLRDIEELMAERGLSVEVLHLGTDRYGCGQIGPGSFQAVPSNDAKTQAWPWRSLRPIPSTWPFLIICTASIP